VAHLPEPIEAGRLPAPDVVVNVPGLGPCYDTPDRSVALNSREPVMVMVHGCEDSVGRFRSLAQVYAFHGQQAVCFSYDDRDSLLNSADRLIAAFNGLAEQTHNNRFTVMGHSMGGLIVRKALERDPAGAQLSRDMHLQLLTVSAPFAGIRLANPCGIRMTHWLSLGLVPVLCKAISGDNWYEITDASAFISQPGSLLPTVQRHLKIVTDERGTCRRRGNDGRCVESDYVFSLEEQYQPAVDSAPQTTNVEVRAGHVEIVGDRDTPPRKLLKILQREGMLVATPPGRRAALEGLLAELY
jgi:hypothetical protein